MVWRTPNWIWILALLSNDLEHVKSGQGIALHMKSYLVTYSSISKSLNSEILSRSICSIIYLKRNQQFNRYLCVNIYSQIKIVMLPPFIEAMEWVRSNMKATCFVQLLNNTSEKQIPKFLKQRDNVFPLRFVWDWNRIMYVEMPSLRTDTQGSENKW